MSHRSEIKLNPLERNYLISICILSPLVSIVDGLTVLSAASLASLFTNSSPESHTFGFLQISFLDRWFVLAVFFSLFVVRSILRLSRILIEANFRKIVLERLSQEVFTSQITKNNRGNSKTSSAEMLRDLSSINPLLQASIFSKVVIFEEVLTISLITFVVLWQSPVISLAVFVCGSLLLYFAHKKFSEKIVEVGKEASMSQGKRMEFALFVYRSVKELALYGKIRPAVSHFQLHSYATISAERRYELISKFNQVMLEVVIVFVALVTLWLTTLVADRPDDVLPVALTIAVGIFRLIPSLSRLIAAFHERSFSNSQNEIIARYLNEYVASDLSHNAKDNKFESLKKVQSTYGQINDSDEVNLEVRNLTFSYSQEQPPVITKLNHIFQIGSLHVIRGESGIGKSTLLSMIMGDAEAQEGQIFINQVPLKSSLIFKEHQIAYVPQAVSALDYSLLDNITLAFGENETFDEKGLWSAINAADLAGFVDSLTDGLDTKLGEFGSKVSGGQLQRIGLARALYRKPRILLLDEATSNLDDKTADKILKDLDNAKDQRLIIIVSHSDRVAQFADKILELG